ncbi:MAG: sugar transferase [Verrucomicrobia bacterium]|nr:sugar transferase [Verrucomicrobiota bacterium]
MKRGFDILASAVGLLVGATLLIPICFLIWLQDRHSPFYIAERAGKGHRPFRMVKIRSMIVKADQTGVDSTAGDDKRITPLGHLVRKLKLDELSQLWNVLKGDMSLVGPRPNVPREVALYTAEENTLLEIRPGITDLSSIVFADEGDILQGAEDPDLRYHQIIRPWKSRLGLLYVKKSGFFLDLKLIFLTFTNSLARAWTLQKVSQIVSSLGGDPELVEAASRRKALSPKPPPGSDQVVQKRASK